MSDELQGNWAPALLKARQDFSQKDPLMMAECSGAKYLAGEGSFLLHYRGQEYTVEFPTGNMVVIGSNAEISNSDQTLLLRYLASTSGLPLRGHWLTFMELPNGPHHQAPFLKEALEPLATDFGAKPELLLSLAKTIGGQSMAAGHAGVVVPVLPKLPLAVVLWAGDDEFPPRANILFDAVAPTYLDTASLYVLGINFSLWLRRHKEK